MKEFEVNMAFASQLTSITENKGSSKIIHCATIASIGHEECLEVNFDLSPVALFYLPILFRSFEAPYSCLSHVGQLMS